MAAAPLAAPPATPVLLLPPLAQLQLRLELSTTMPVVVMIVVVSCSRRLLSVLRDRLLLLLLPPLAQLQFLLSTMMLQPLELQPLELQPLELLQLQPVVVVTGPLWPVLYRPRLVPPLQLHL